MDAPDTKLHEAVEEYIATHPTIAEAMRVFDVSLNVYEAAVAASSPVVVTSSNSSLVTLPHANLE